MYAIADTSSTDYVLEKTEGKKKIYKRIVSCWLEEAADFIVGACVTEGGAGGCVCALARSLGDYMMQHLFLWLWGSLNRSLCFGRYFSR